MPRLRLILFWALALVACDGPGPLCDAGLEPDCLGPADLIVDGVNLTALTQTPTNAEVDSVRAFWAELDRNAGGAQAAEVVTIRSFRRADNTDIRVLAGVDPSTRDTLFFAGYYAPPRLNGDARLRPLILSLPESGAVIHLTASPTPFSLGTVAANVNVVVIANPGQTLVVDGRTYRATGPADAYGREVDLALSVVRSLRSDLLLGIDPQKLVAIGVAKGGTVATLAAQRALPFKVIVAIQPPTSFFLTDVRLDLARALRGQPLNSVPAMEHVADVSARAVRSGMRTLDQARIELLRRSPAEFTQASAFYIIAMGQQIPKITVDHPRVLAGRLVNTRSATFETEDTTIEGLVANQELRSFVQMKIYNDLVDL